MELADRLETKFRLDLNQKKALNKLNLFLCMIYFFISLLGIKRYERSKKISELIPGETVTVCGKISKLKTKKGFRSKIPMGEAEIEDLSGKIKITWFHQAYLAKMIHESDNVKLTGKVTESKYGRYLANPEFEKVAEIESVDNLFKKNDSENTGFSYPYLS